MAIALRHVGVVVSDLNESLSVFCDDLGCELVARYDFINGEYISTLVGIHDVEISVAIIASKDGGRLELLQYHTHSGRKRKQVLSNDVGVSHVALTVENLQQLFNNRDISKIRFISAPLSSPDGKVKVAYAVILGEALLELVEDISTR